MDSSVSSIRKKILYCKHVHHNPSNKYTSRRESGFMFCETIEIISSRSHESSRKHENLALKSTMTKQWSSLIQQ